MKMFLKKHILIISLIIIAIVVYWRWFSFAIFSKGDWPFMYAETAKAFLNIVSWDHLSNMGGLNLTLWRLPLNIFYGIFGFFGFDKNIFEKYLVFWPTLIAGFLGSYFLIKKITNSKFGAFIGALIFNLNTYYLASSSHILLYSAAGFAIIALYLYIEALERKKIIWYVLCALSLFITGSYDFRILYLIFFIFVGYFLLYLYSKKTNLIQDDKLSMSIGMGFIVILLNLYWIIAFIKTGSLESNDIVNRALFGNSYWNIQSAFTLSHPFWSGGYLEWFKVQVLPFYFWITPICTFSILFFARKRSVIIFFGIVSLLGVFLTKQVDNPFPYIYPWLHSHLPGFNAFREASKFYFYVALGYSILIAELISTSARWKSSIRYLLVIVIITVFCHNALPILTGEIGTLFVPRHVPNEYKILNYFIKNQPESFRTLWIPNSSSWFEYTNLHSKLNIASMLDESWQDIIYSLGINNKKTVEKISYLFQQDLFAELTNSSSIKYIIVPLSDVKNDNDLFKDYSILPSYFISQLDNISYLHRVDIGTTELVVYENKNYKPHISTLDSLLKFPSFSELEDTYRFATGTLKKEFDFIVSDSKKTEGSYPVTRITRLFETINPQDLAQGRLQSAPTTGSGAVLYQDTSRSDISYSMANGTLQFFTTNDNLLRDNNKAVSTSYPSQKFESLRFDPRKKYLAESNGRLIPLLEKSDPETIEPFRNPVRVLEVSDQNNIHNPSFENGLWSTEVGDCNNYDDKGKLDMRTSSVAIAGQKSLELEATRHIACTGQQSISVQADTEYVFQFDYQSPNAKRAGYYINLGTDTGSGSTVSERLPIADDAWHTFTRRIRIPSGSDKISLVVYSYGNEGGEEKPNIVRYDNFILSPLRELTVMSPEQKNTFTPLPLETSATHDFMLTNKQYSFANLIRNASLEEGLWSEKVGDCNNYDENGKLAMRSSGISSDENTSLELEAANHIACTGPDPMPVKAGSTYLLSFDYQGQNATEAGYYLSFGGVGEALSERLPIRDAQWHTFTKQIAIPSGATSASLLVYGYSRDQETPIITRYDNFRFTELPDIANRYYVVDDPKTDFVKPREITYEMINPTKKIVHVRGATTPFYLAMSESYHPQWQAEFDNEKVRGFFSSWTPWVAPDRIPAEHHFELDGFLNGWYIDTDAYCAQQNLCMRNDNGSYDMDLVIEFTPQRWFYVGLLISGTTLLACLSYLAYCGVRHYRQRRPLSSRRHHRSS